MTGPTPLPSYSGDKPVCPKCQFEGAATQYMRIGRCLHDGSHTTIGMTQNERLHRECSRCGYGWDEALAHQEAP